MKNKDENTVLTVDTFGDPLVYKTLPCIIEKLNEMEPSRRRYFSKYITVFHTRVRELLRLVESDPAFADYVRKLMHAEYRSQIDKLHESAMASMEKFVGEDPYAYRRAEEHKFFTHLQNYVYAKLSISVTEELTRISMAFKLKQHRDAVDQVLDLPRFQVFGSRSSQDYDVIVFVKEMSSVIDDNHRRIKILAEKLDVKFAELGWPSKVVNANIGVLRDGMLIRVFKGTPDEVNNSLYRTYSNHAQNHRNQIRKQFERTWSGNFYAQLKLKRCFRFILSFFSRIEELRPVIKPAMKGDFNVRMDALVKIDMTRHTDFSGKNEDPRDIYKVIAFQLAQTLLLFRGIEIYSKEEVLEHYPALARPIKRQELRPEDLLFMNALVTQLIELGRHEVQFMRDPVEEIHVPVLEAHGGNK